MPDIDISKLTAPELDELIASAREAAARPLQTRPVSLEPPADKRGDESTRRGVRSCTARIRSCSFRHPRFGLGDGHSSSP